MMGLIFIYKMALNNNAFIIFFYVVPLVNGYALALTDP